MHLYIVPRGIQNQLDLWKAMVQSQFFKFRRKNLDTGEDEIVGVQGALRPSILGTYEYVFPKEALTEVISMLHIDPKNHNHPKMKMLRLMMGLKKIPQKVIEEAQKKPKQVLIDNMERLLNWCVVGGVDVHIIGIKEDKIQDYDFGKEGRFHQEGL